MRRCKIPTGCKLPGHPCCADCGDKACTARCWNRPERCRCWEEPQPPKRPGRGRQYDWDEVEQLHQEGLSNLAIAARLGCSEQQVSVILRKLGGKRNG